MAINDLLKNSTKGEVPQQAESPNLSQPNLSQRIDQKLSEIAQRNPVIGKFFASAVGGVKGFVENPIQGARGLAGGIVAAPEKFIRTIGAAANKTTDSAYDEATGRPAIYIENGVPTLKQKKTLSGLIGGDPSMGQAIKLGEKDSLRKSTGLAIELGLFAGVPGLKGLSTAGKIGASSAIGAGFGITGEMQQDNPDYIAGAGAGFGIGGLLGGASAIAGKVKGKGKTTEMPIAEEKPIIPDGDVPPPSIPDGGIPSKVKGKTTEIPIIEEKPVIPEVEGGVETKLSREIRAEYPELKKATYKKKTLKEVEAEALDIMNKTPDQVDDIAMGRRTTNIPELDSRIQELAIEKARKAGNIEKIGEIMQNTVSSKIGQSLALLQRSASDEYSFTNMLRKAQTLKAESIPKLKKVRHDYIKEQGKKEISEARKIKLKAAYKFLDDLIC